MRAIINWLIFLLLLTVLWFGVPYAWKWGRALLIFPKLSGAEVLFFSLCLAFFWVEVKKWGIIKPFNCLKCMTGWFALILALIFHIDAWYLYPFAGVFIGAIFSAVKMKWL